MAASTQIQEPSRADLATRETARRGGRWPQITLVTVGIAAEAGALESTMQSVVQQQYPNLEYLLVDAGGLGSGSADQTGIVRLVCSERNPLAALNTAFAQSAGEILGWLNPGELLHTGALFALAAIFSDLPQVDWVTGIPTVFGASGEAVAVKHLERWSRTRFLAGANKYIHRDTTFWRRRLWDRAGGTLPPEAERAPEFELFTRFFRHARLYSAEALLGGWRTHPGDFARGEYREYNRACDEIADRELAGSPGLYAAKAFRNATRLVNRIPLVRRYWHKLVLQGLYRIPGPDWPPKIVHRAGRWQIA
jgi:glycosyltransferase involved in cell wall biosynthesis